MSARLPLKDIVFISEFAAYARGREPGEAYDYCSNRNCACAQFLKDTGRSRNPSVADAWDDDEGVEHLLPPGVDDAAAADNNPARVNWTWGALATRLESLLSDMKVEVGK